MNVPPINAFPTIPKPPLATIAPELVPKEEFVLVTLTVPPINALPASPRPPETTTAPVPVDIDAVLDSNLDAEATYKLPPIPVPPETIKAPVELLTAGDVPITVRAIPAENPVAERTPVAGFIKIVVTVERPKPVPFDEETKVG